MIDILILESDTVAALGLAHIIEEWGYRVVGIAENYQSAMHYCENAKFELVIAETKIDGEPDGIETAFILHEIYNIQVIFITSHIDSDTLTRVSKVQFMGYLLKPYRKDALSVLLQISAAKHHFLKHSVSSRCGYVYNTHLNKIYYNDREIVLTPHEKLLFLLLFYERDALVTHEKIAEVIWNDAFVSSETRRQLVHRLKMKLPADSVETVRAQGYRLR